ncbi:MAG: putative glycolipid-binding domain-containing protein, partial [Sciscionella sp.]
MSTEDMISPASSPVVPPDASEHTIAWAGDSRFEFTHATLRLGTLSARGTMLLGGAEPYRVDYHLDTAAGFLTRRLTLSAAGLGWSRTLRLARDAEGGWVARRTAERPEDQEEPLDPSLLADAPDCDLAFSPLTGAMPVLRHRLHRTLGRHVVIAARVAVPELTVSRREHTYT